MNIVQCAKYILMTFSVAVWIRLIFLHTRVCNLEMFGIRQNPITNGFHFQTFPHNRNPYFRSYLSMCLFLNPSPPGTAHMRP